MDSLVVSGMPDVLRSIGFGSLPITIDSRHGNEALNGQCKKGSHKFSQEYLDDHTFTLSEFAKLPEKIADPIAITFDKRRGKEVSNSTIDIFVEMTVASGKQVVVPVGVSSSGRIDGIRMDSIKVKSVHGNVDAIDRLVNAIDSDSDDHISLFYIKKEKNTKVIGGAMTNSHGGLQNLDGFIHSIKDAGSPVKEFSKRTIDT